MMIKASLALVLATVCVLLFHEGASAPVEMSRAAPPSLTTEEVDGDECSGTIDTEDAAACQDGGWQYAGCCTGGPIVRTKWTRNGISKCCGTCFF